MRRAVVWLIPVVMMGLVGGGFWFGRLFEQTTRADSASPSVSDNPIVASEVASLRVDSSPDGVLIFLNDEASGKQTPTVFEALAPGDYRIRLESDDYFTWSAEMQLKAGDAGRVKAVLVAREQTVLPALALVSSLPAAGGEVPAPDSDAAAFEVLLTFDRPLAAETAVKSVFSLQEIATGRELLTAVSYEAGSNSVKLRVAPASLISATGRYRVRVDLALTGVSGETLSDPLIIEFGQGNSSVSGTQPTSLDSLLDQVRNGLAGNLNEAQRRDIQRKADLAEIQEALELYTAANGKYPEMTEEKDLTELRDILIPFYLLQLPRDPLATEDAVTLYQYQSVGAGYRLKATLESPAVNETAAFVLTEAI